jgi:type I restriction enzyme M protein
MAIAEHVGHDRRGMTIYRRDPDGYDLYQDHRERFEGLRDGLPFVEERVLRRPVLADDLPVLARAFEVWSESGELPDIA